MTSLSRRSILLATATFLLSLTVAPAEAGTGSIQLDAAIRDHGFGPAGAQAARFVSRTQFAGSTALHRLRAADRATDGA